MNNVKEDLRETSGSPPEDILPSVLHFGKIPKKYSQNLAKFNKMLANFAKILSKISKSRVPLLLGFPGLPHAVDGVDHDVGEEHDIQHLIYSTYGSTRRST